MAYRAVFKPSFLKDLTHGPKPIQLRCELVVDDIIEDPFARSAKKLGGYDGLYRLRLGDYRLVYYVNHREQKISFLFVGHRKDIYRHLKQYQ